MKQMRATTAISLIFGFAAALQPWAAAYGQNARPVVAANNATNVRVTSNGTPVVNIATPRADGTSYNVFTRFNVGREGVIINNSPVIGRSVLGGQVLPNSKLTRGGKSASLILSEVVSGTRSDLRGAIEVFGPQASFVLANPAGITCNGCGFINIARASLTTGRITFGGDGAFTGFAVDGGDVRIEGQGLLAGNVDFFDIITRTAVIDADLYARDLVISGGAADFDYANRTATARGAAGERLAIDSTLLGGMYANRIRLIGSGAGVGVNLQGLVNALEGPLAITAQGTIAINRAASATDVTVRSTNNSIVVADQLYAGGSAQLDAGTNIIQAGNFIGAANDVTLTAGAGILLGGSGVYAGLGDSGRLDKIGSIAITAAGRFDTIGAQLIATDGLRGTSDSINFDVASALSGRDVTLATTRSLISNGLIESTTKLSLTGDTVRLGGSIIANDTLGISGRALALDGRAIGISGVALRATEALGLGASADLQTNGRAELAGQSIDNGGRVLGVGGVNVASATTLANSGALLSGTNADVASGGDATISGTINANQKTTLAVGGRANVSGTVAAAGELTLTAQALDLSGTLSSSGKLSAKIIEGLIATAPSSIVGDGAVTLDGRTIAASGAISTGQTLDITATDSAALLGQTNATGKLAIKGAAVTLGGVSVSNADISVDSLGAAQIDGAVSARTALRVTAGSITSASGAQLVAGESVSLTSAGAIDNAGAVSANRTALDASSNLTNRGSLFAANTLDIKARGAVTQSGIAESGGGLTLTSDSLVLAGKTLGTTGLSATARTISASAAGDLQSGGALSLVASEGLTSAGAVISVGDLRLTSGTDLTQNAAITLGRSGTFAATGALAQNGIVEAVGTIELGGRSITGSGSLLTDSNVIVRALAAGIDLTGDISARSSVSLSAPGSIRLGGNVATDGMINLSAADLTLGGDTVAAQGFMTAITGELSLTESGTLRSGTGLALDLGALDNRGIISALGALTLATRQDLTNRGLIVADRAIALTASGAITNDGRISGGGTLTANGASLLSSGTIESAAALALTAGTVNLGGRIASSDRVAVSSANGALGLDGKLNGTTVTLSSLGGDVSVGETGVIEATEAASLLSNRAIVVNGTLASNQGITANASGGAITFARTAAAQTGGAFKVTASGAITNVATLTAGGAIALAGDSITSGNLLANGNIGLNAAGAIRVDGGIDSAGDAALISRNGAITITLPATIATGKALTLQAAQGITNLGSLAAQTALTATGGTLFANEGQIVARTGELRLGANALTLNGNVFAGTNLVLNSDAITIGGLVGSDGALGLTSANLTIGSAGTLQSNKAVSLAHGSGQIDGTLRALDTLGLTATSLTIGASGLIESGKAQSVTTTGRLANAGLLSSADTLSLTAATLDNSGTLSATGNLAIGGTSFINSGLASGNALLDITSANLNVGAAGILRANNALTINGLTAANAGIIEAAGAVTVTARDALTNSNIVRSNAAVALASNSLADISGSVDAGTTLAISGGETRISGGLAANGNVALAATSGPLTISGTVDSGAIVDLRATAGALTVTAPATVFGNGGVTGNARDIAIAGSVAAPRAINLNATNAFDLTGSVVSNEAATLGGGVSLNVAATGSVNAQSIALSGGVVRTIGDVVATNDVAITATTSTTVDGLISAGQNINANSMTSASFNVGTAGRALAGQSITLGGIGGVLVDGLVSAARDVNVGFNGFANVPGRIEAGNDVIFTNSGTRALFVNGQVVANNNITALGGFLSVPGSFSAGNIFRVITDRADTDLVSVGISGTVTAGRVASISAAGGLVIGNNGALLVRDGFLDLLTGFTNIGGTASATGTAIFATRNDLGGLPGNDFILNGLAQSGGALTVNGTRGVFIGSNGTLLSNDRVSISGPVIQSTGTIAANDLVSLSTTSDLLLGGLVQSGRRIAVQSARDFTLQSGGRVETIGNAQSIGFATGRGADANIDIRVSRTFLNQGTLFSDGAISLGSGSGDLTNNGTISAVNDIVLTSNFGRVFTGTGALTSTNLAIHQTANFFSNTGTLTATGNLLVSAIGITNSGLLGANGTLTLVGRGFGVQNVGGGTIFSTGNLSIESGIGFTTGLEAFRNENSTILSLGNITINARDVLNRSGRIESLGGNVTINATNLINQIKDLVIEQDPLGDRIITNSGAAQIIAAGNLAITATGDITNSNSNLLAGGDITLTANTVNNLATIIRGTGTADMVLPTAITAGGNVTINAALVNNGTITPQGVFNGTGDMLPGIMVTGANGQGGRGTFTLLGTPAVNPAAILPTAKTALGGKGATAAGVTVVTSVAGGALANGTATGTGAGVIGAAALVPVNTGGLGVAGVNAVNANAATTANGLGLTAQLARAGDGFNGLAIPGILGAGGRAGSFISDFLRQFNLVGANGNFGIAGGGRLFTFNDSPDTQFLFTTNPGFATVGALLDSSFFFAELGVDRGTNFTRLGDGFFELQLITQQIRAATGEAQLSEFGNTLDQAKGLLQNALDQKDKLKLSLGVALTSDQINNLTSSIVWYVKSTVGTREVLVPVVYLAASDKKIIKGGAIVSGTNVVANVTNNLLNGGRIEASRVVSLTSSGDIVNAAGGRIAAADVVAKSARDIITRGQIEARNNVVLNADRNIIVDGNLASRSSSTTTGAGTNSVTTATRTEQSFTGSSITAGGNIALGAGNRLTVTGSKIAAGDTVQLSGVNGVTLNAGQSVATDTVATSSSSNQQGRKNVSVANVATSNSTTTTVTNTLTDITAGQGIGVSSTGQVNIVGAKLATTGTVAITGAAVNVASVADSTRTISSASNTSTTTQKDGRKTNLLGVTSSTTNSTQSQTSARLSEISGAQGVGISATGQVNISGGAISSDKTVSLSGGSVTVSNSLNNLSNSVATSTTTDVARSNGRLRQSTDNQSNSSAGQKVVSSTLSGDVVSITAKNDATLGGTIKAGDVFVQSRDINLATTGTTSSSTSLNNNNGRFNNTAKSGTGVTGAVVDASRSVVLDASRNIDVSASTIKAGQNATLVADGNVNIGSASATENQSSSFRNGKRNFGTSSANSSTATGSNVSAGGDLTIASGGALGVQGSNLAAGRDVILIGDGGIQIVASQNSTFETSNARLSKKKTVSSTATSATNTLSGITAGGDTSIDSPGAIKVAGANITSTGETSLVGQTVDITGVKDRSTLDTFTQVKKKKTFSKKVTTTTSSNVTETALASAIEGGTVTIGSVGDTTVKGSNIVSDRGTSISAGGDITVGTVVTESSQSDSTKVKKSGISVGFTGISAGVGKSKNENATTLTQNNGSVIASVDGDVNLTANKAISITGSQVVSPDQVNITAERIDITNAIDTVINTSKSKSSSVGISVGFGPGGPSFLPKELPSGLSALESIQRLQQMATAAAAAKTDRTKAVSVMATLLAAKNAYDANGKAIIDDAISGIRNAFASNGQSVVAAVDKAVDKVKSGVDGLLNGGIGEITGAGIIDGIKNAGVTVKVGVSKSKSSSQSIDQTVVGSQISGGDVNLTARGAGDKSTVTVTGSKVAATRDLTVTAPGAITFQSAQENDSSTSKNKSSGLTVGATIGAGGVTPSFSVNLGKGNSNGTSVTNVESVLSAGGTARVTTPGALTLEGAQLSGDTVKVNAGSLTITSQQDTANFKSKQTDLGLSADVGRNEAGASFGQSKQSGSFKSVQEQSGITAGKGGFDINVAGRTQLNGAVIASTADPARNNLTTGELGTTTIENSEKFKASSVGLSTGLTGIGSDVNTGGGGSNGISTPLGTITGGLPSVQSASGSQSSTTNSAIAGGTINITSGDPASLGVAQTISRDTSGANTPLTQKFDANKRAEIEEGFAAARELAGQVSQFLSNRAREADMKRNEARDAEAKGDIAKANLLNAEANRIESQFSTGGTYRQVLTALSAAAGGNVTGGVGALVRDAAVSVIQQRGAGLIGDLAKEGKITEVQAGLLHTLTGCLAGAAGSDGSCGASAAGQGGAVILNTLLDRLDGSGKPLSNEDREARSALVQAIVAAVGTVAGLDGSALGGAIVSAQAETENNRLGLKQQQEFDQKLALCENRLCRNLTRARYYALSAKQDGAFVAGFLASPFIDAYSTVEGIGKITIAIRDNPQGVIDAINETLNDKDIISKIGTGLLNEYVEKFRILEDNAINGGTGNAFEAGKITFELLSTLIGVGAVARITSRIAVTGGKLAGGIGAGSLENSAKLINNIPNPPRLAAGVALDPRLPDPVAGLDYSPTRLSGGTEANQLSQINGYRAELEFANRVAAIPGETVVRFGSNVNTPGADIISVRADGTVSLFDAKFRSNPSNVQPTTTFAQGSNTLRRALVEARDAIEASNLPEAVKVRARANLDAGNFNAHTPGAGAARNSVITRFCNNKICGN